MIYVGTSGWMYDWNEGGSLEWYVKNSNLNAVELNMSFYRFPYRNQVKGWSKYSLRWAVKVNRYITHVKKLNDLDSFRKFMELMEGLKPDFYLFQLPPSFKFNEENLEKVKKFSSFLGKRMAIEFRDKEWYERGIDINSVIVSIDSPIGTYIVNNVGIIYLRFHGRKEWYSYNYSEGELREIALKVKELKPEKVYLFFNNNHNMLENARLMMRIMKEVISPA